MNRKRIGDIKKYSVMWIPIVALLVGFYIPTGSVVVFSFWENTTLWMEPGFSLEAYESIFSENLTNMLYSFGTGAIVGVLSGIFGFIVGYFVTFMISDSKRMIILSILAIPFVVNELVRILMWVPILGQSGIINDTLMSIGLIQSPVEFLFLSDFSVILVSTATFLPFVIFTSWLSMDMIDEDKITAAADLDARPLDQVLSIVIPLSLAGIAIGVVFAFASTIGNSDIPFVVGGVSGSSIGRLAVDSFDLLNPPKAAAFTTLTLVFYTVVLLLISRRVDLASLFTTGGGQ